jgi:hypothetical protein
MAHDLRLNLDRTLVRPLAQAQNEFVQVLLSAFRLRQNGQGLTLEVEFDFDTLAIWLRKGKAHVGAQLDRDRMATYANQLKSRLLGVTKGDYEYEDPSFPFRFGNGGTLPVIRIGEDDYYCLFYRETDPIGWNIANGGAESVTELLDPFATIERELREELIIVEPEAGNRYVFEWSEGRRADHPDFAVARRIWQKMFHNNKFRELRELALPLKWLPGPDSVVVRFDQQPPVETCDCVLNINADDFGIEIDRVAKMSVGPGAVLCDGELVRGSLLNRVVGLFQVDGFNAAMTAGLSEYRPERFFWSGRDRSGENLDNVVLEYVEDVDRQRIFASPVRPSWESKQTRFGLCPVTDTVIRRHRSLEHESSLSLAQRVPPKTTEIFLSFCTEDREFAQRVFGSLNARGRRVFFSDQTLHQSNFSDAIDDALKAARALVVVGTQPAHFFKPWVRFEWQSFHNDILGGRKPWITPLITVLGGNQIDALPRPLAFRQVLTCDPKSPEVALQKLASLLD